MHPTHLISLCAFATTLLGPAVLTLADANTSWLDDSYRVAAADVPWQSLAAGIFLLSGIFWIGAIDKVRRALEPTPMDGVLRFSALAFGASYLFRILLPCQASCPAEGSSGQWLYRFIVWALYVGAGVFAHRTWQQAAGPMKSCALGVLGALVLMLGLGVLFSFGLGLWQRLYEALFCLLWWQWLTQWRKQS